MAAGATYEPIATTILGSSASTITLSSIPSTYTDLVLTANYEASSAAASGGIQLNGDTTAGNYFFEHLANMGSSATGGERVGNRGWLNWKYGSTTNTSNIFEMHILQYANTSISKTALMRGGNTAHNELLVGRWNSTAAINSITLDGSYGGFNFLSGATVTLWGITKA